jgi:hypothetical protein
MQLYRRGQERGTAARWEDLPAPLRDHLSRAEVMCHGCRSDTVFAGCRDCGIRKCAKAKAVAACAECPDFPCAQLRGLVKRVAAIRERLPHTAAIGRAVELAKEKSAAAWRESQRTQWSCSSCGRPFTWYQQRCQGCGLDLTAIRGY